MLLSEDDDVVQAFPPKGPNHALAVRTLPRGTRRGEDLFDSQRMRSTNEGCAIDLVPVSDDVLRRSCSSTTNTYRMRNVAVGTTRARSLCDAMPITVSGFTRIKMSCHAVDRRESATQSARSILASLGRLLLRFSTASCCRKARFSRASSRRDLRLDRAVASRAYTK